MPVLNPSSTLVMDNGASSIKVNFSNLTSARVIPNCICKAKSEKRRAFVGDQIDECRDLSSLFYILPFQKGYLLNWEHQKTVWDYVFGKSCLNVEPQSKDLIFTEPYFNFASIQEGLNEVLFEEYRFRRVLRTNPADLVCYKNKVEHPEEECCLVVDAGFSFTHIVPFVRGRRVTEAVIRIDVGGKMLTNHLKEIISYRQLHVLDETHVMNACKEDCCYISLDFQGDMRKAEKRLHPTNNIVCDYVLPDFTARRRGFMRSPQKQQSPDEQIVRMNVERFTVPELLFHPSDVGIEQVGIPEALVHAASRCPESTRRWLYRNVVLVGGCSRLPGMRERVERDLRALAPANYEVRVRLPEDPATYPWEGGAALAADPAMHRKMSVTREEYLERGHQACTDKFYL